MKLSFETDTNIRNVLSIFGNLISFGSYTVCVKWELGWLVVWSNF